MAKSQYSLDPPIMAAVDRGPARYFHGREQILHNFGEVIERAKEGKNGTTFLIQGAPGVGKSALLAECERLAGGRGWKAVEIDEPALWDPDALRDFLDLRKIPVITSWVLRLGWERIANAELRVDWYRRTIRKILQKGKQPLLLMLDEAQMLGTINKPSTEQAKIASSVLKAIHNGTLGRPVVLLATGLGTTSYAFRSLGISRFAQNCRIKLGALSKESEHAVIQDWLKKDGGAKGDLSAWIDAIAQETHGWPHHILSYVIPATDQLKANDGIMTTVGLKAVLKAGHIGRVAYYEERADDFRGDQIRCLARSVAGVPQGKPAEYKDLMFSMKTEYGKSGAKKLFNDFEKKGLLEASGAGYMVPIPSMHNWLVSNYVRKK